MFDLIIVGGGLVGAGLAASLQNLSLKIALIDARIPSNDDPRLFALNHNSCQFLKNLSLWEKLCNEACAIEMVHVSRRGYFGTVRLHHKEVGLSYLGYVIPAKHIEFALNERLNALSNCTVFRPAKLIALEQCDQEATLTIQTDKGEQRLRTTLVIGADGTDSTVRKLAGMDTQHIDYQQSAIVTRTALTRSHQHIAYERFTHNGAIAMLPLASNANHECATIWSAERSYISQLMNESDNIFLQQLQEAFGYKLGKLKHISKRHIFPLHMVQAKQAKQQCVYLLGNAAHTLHPIAAQGFNLALYEVAILAEEIMRKASGNHSFTAVDLDTVTEKIQQQQANSLGLSHRLSQISSSKSISLAMQCGMLGLDLFPVIKRKFLRTVMGRDNSVPYLLSNQYYEKNVTT